MKELKENIQRNNIKKIVLSATLGMFCYCINNAMEEENDEKEEKNEGIIEVLNIMTKGQVYISQAKEDLKNYEKKIYHAIKGKEEKINKKNVLDFIKNIYTTEGQQQKDFDNDDIKTIEQYFHLDKLALTDECKDENLTETFWTAPETNKGIQEEIIIQDENKEEEEEGEKELIRAYFNTIIAVEKETSEAFKEYYAMKKKQKPKAQDEDILKEIMEDCCGEKKQGDKVTRVIENLRKMWNKQDVENKDDVLTTIRTRISLGIDTPEKEFIYFLKQKIGEEKKEEGVCPCCYDCCKNKKNKMENNEIKYEEYEEVEGEEYEEVEGEDTIGKKNEEEECEDSE